MGTRVFYGQRLRPRNHTPICPCMGWSHLGKGVYPNPVSRSRSRIRSRCHSHSAGMRWWRCDSRWGCGRRCRYVAVGVPVTTLHAGNDPSAQVFAFHRADLTSRCAEGDGVISEFRNGPPKNLCSPAGTSFLARLQ
jgi:hypothetical protein